MLADHMDDVLEHLAAVVAAAGRASTDMKTMSYDGMTALGREQVMHECHRSVVDLEQRLDTCEMYWAEERRFAGMADFSKQERNCRRACEELSTAAARVLDCMSSASNTAVASMRLSKEYERAVEMVNKVWATVRAR